MYCLSIGLKESAKIGKMIVEDNHRAVKMLVYVSLLRQVVLTLNLLITLFLTLF